MEQSYNINQDDRHEDSSNESKSMEGLSHSEDPENPAGGDGKTGAAENLVRNEAITIRFLRGAVIILLVTAATLTGLFTHRLAAKNQMDSFTRDFKYLAQRLVDTFEDGIGSYLYQSYTLSVAISEGLYAGSEPHLPDVTLANLDELTSSLRLKARALDIVWSPLLATREEKRSWEKYAASMEETTGVASSGKNAPCYFCGEGNEIANPNNQIRVPALGTYACSSVQNAAVSGALTPAYCAAGMKMVPAACGCQKSNQANNATQNMTNTWKISDGIFRVQDGAPVHDIGPTPFSPVWQISPSTVGKEAIMFNQLSDPIRRKAIKDMIQFNLPVFSQSYNPATNTYFNLLQTQVSFGLLGTVFYPVYKSSLSNIVAGSLAINFAWERLLEVGLSEQAEGSVIVLENTCGRAYTFKVSQNQVHLQGEEDLHDETFDSLEVSSNIDDFLKLLRSITPRAGPEAISQNWGCAYKIRVYPSMELRSRYLTSKPWVQSVIVVSIFIFTSLVFLLYDMIVRRLQTKVVNSAKRSEAIVSSLFPEVVRDRLYGEGQGSHCKSQQAVQSAKERKQPLAGHRLLNHKIRLKNFLAQPSCEDVTAESDPIADLFPNTTILFADIAGFTAWASEREPAQVFKLLESLYGAFDQVAKKLGVFKIETIGDCYVAVSGLPEPREDHAVIMVKFASECMYRMGDVTKRLETSLGPGTADLVIRVGLHSGPVTGGVLRGERARFQLFGDAVNTASRMESTGEVNKIHLSNETAQLLIKSGKSDWVEKRAKTVVVKGKGELQTYWAKPLKPRGRKASLSSDAPSSNGNNNDVLWGATNLDTTILVTSPLNRRDRLIAWNADLLEQFLQKIVAMRKAQPRRRSLGRMKSFEKLQNFKYDTRRPLDVQTQVVEEITEMIRMPAFNHYAARDEVNPSQVDIGTKVRSQLRDFVANIAALYPDNAFHNFEHASHVVMSASKLLKRIIAPDDVDYRADDSGKTLKSSTVLSKEIHDSTYGISSDPLMQFAVIFSALIHDVEHTGLQNRQLVQSNDPLAHRYHGKCVAEQHSVNIAWEELIQDRYSDLRRCIHQTEDDRLRFRQLVINAVIATDISDKELQAWRQNRWNKAFHEQEDESTMDRKATLLFEYILQASDVAPTMQHWHIYQKWNQRLFEERYMAYQQGKDEVDPSESWYEGELSFFDKYVIPLARNLEESNVFGVSCGDYLAYAVENRREWEVKGQKIVNQMIAASQKAVIDCQETHKIDTPVSTKVVDLGRQ